MEELPAEADEWRSFQPRPMMEELPAEADDGGASSR
jgi:hypothetical protein